MDVVVVPGLETTSTLPPSSTGHGLPGWRNGMPTARRSQRAAAEPSCSPRLACSTDARPRPTGSTQPSSPRGTRGSTWPRNGCSSTTATSSQRRRHNLPRSRHLYRRALRWCRTGQRRGADAAHRPRPPQPTPLRGQRWQPPLAPATNSSIEPRTTSQTGSGPTSAPATSPPPWGSANEHSSDTSAPNSARRSKPRSGTTDRSRQACPRNQRHTHRQHPKVRRLPRRHIIPAGLPRGDRTHSSRLPAQVRLALSQAGAPLISSTARAADLPTM